MNRDFKLTGSWVLSLSLLPQILVGGSIYNELGFHLFTVNLGPFVFQLQHRPQSY